MTRVRFSVLLAALLLGTAANAAPPPEAVKLFKKCIREYEAGRHATARTCFQRVYGMYKSPVVLVNLAKTEEALGNLVEAYEDYRACSADTSGTLSAEERADVEQRTEALIKRLGLIALPALPVGAVVLVDGKTRNPAVVGGIAVMPGDHDVRVEAPGMQAWSERVSLAAGQSRMLAVVLQPVAPPPPETPPAPPPEQVNTPPAPATAPVRPASPPTPPPLPPQTPYVPPPTTSGGSGLRVTGLVLGALGVAGLATGTAFGVLAMNDNNAAKKECSVTTKDLCSPRGVSLTNQAYNRALVATISLAAGGAFLATGVVLYIVGHVKRSENPYGAQVVPVFGPSFAGLTLQRGF